MSSTTPPATDVDQPREDRDLSHRSMWPTKMGKYYNELVELQKLNEPFSKPDLPEAMRENACGILSVSSEHGLIEVVGNKREKQENGRWVERKVFVLSDEVKEIIDALEDQMLPCGHRPFRNYRGEGYGCTWDHCDRVYDRATVLNVADRK